jgi:hypothetical protein
MQIDEEIQKAINQQPEKERLGMSWDSRHL